MSDKRVCTGCKEAKDLTEFKSVGRRNPSRLNTRCVTCVSKYHKDRRGRLAKQATPSADKKQCSSCGETKFGSEFYKNPTSPLGLHAKCKKCVRERQLELACSVVIEQKACSVCHDVKNASEFYTSVNTKDGRMARCRQCCREDAANLRIEVLLAYGGRCACCGEGSDYRFLTLDHVNNDGANLRRTDPEQKKLYRWAKKNNFPDILQVMCFNCNLAKATNCGTCPHTEGEYVIPVLNNAPGTGHYR